VADTPPLKGGESIEIQAHIFLLLIKEEYPCPPAGGSGGRWF